MKLDTWNRVEELFLTAADLPAEEQAKFLEANCAGDARLFDMVSAMLVSDRRKGSRIQAAVEHEATRLFDSPLLAERLGAYRVEREIGRGGMGAVYLATRDDDQFHKRVAIKVIKRGTDTAEALARFRDERQILANLDHAYIARLLDAGTTPDGRPFFVMEYIEGLAVDVFCRNHQLDVKARCRLFLKICEAVAYAQRNLVIHRDLKPANIFVTPEAAPKLLDFGVAKLLSPSGGTQTTSSIARPFTPEYASPEQVLGLPVTTASDIYSLGAVLYELLTGHRAQPVSPGASPKEIERAICETHPVPVRMLVPGLDSDLDNIVFAAMHKEPDRRYRSVDQLAEDIRRYLESRPIIARKDSLWYRAAKFARRQRFALGAAAAVLASLIGGIVIAFSQAHDAKIARQAAEQNRDIAVSERQRAEDRLAQIVNMSDRSLSQVYALMERLPGALPARRELVSNTVTFLQDLSREAGGNQKLQLALAIAYSKLGDIEGDPDSSNIGDFAGAARSYRAAMTLIGDPGRDADRLVLWVDLQDKISKVLPDLGDFDGAKGMLSRAIEYVESSRILSPATVKRLLGQLYLSLSRATIELPQAMELARKSLAAAEDAQRLAPADPAVQLLVSTAQTQVGFIYVLLDDAKASEPFYSESLKIRERLAREYPNDLVYRRLLRLSYEHYAALLADPEHVNLGRPDLARLYYEKARPMEEANAADSQNLLARFDYALFLLDSARIEQLPGSMEKSLAQLRKSAGIISELVRADPRIMRYRRAWSAAHAATGRRLGEMSRYPEAVAEYRRAFSINHPMLSSDPRNLVFVRDELKIETDLARLAERAGDRPTALQSSRDAVRYANQLGAAELAEANLTLAELHREFGECNIAADLARRVLSELPSAQTDSSSLRQRAGALLADCATSKTKAP